MTYKATRITDPAFSLEDLEATLNHEQRNGWELAQLSTTYIVFRKADPEVLAIDAEIVAELDNLRGNVSVALELLERALHTAPGRTFVSTAISWLQRKPDPDAIVLTPKSAIPKKAPWPDMSGDDIYEGDDVRWNESGRRGVVVHNEADGWRIRCEGDSVNPCEYIGLRASAHYLITVKGAENA